MASNSQLFHNAGTLRKSAGAGIASIGYWFGGWFYVNFENVGTVEARSGTIAFYGNYTEATVATLAVSLGGPNAGVQYGNIYFGTPVSVTGIFSVSTRNGFRPNPGDTFNVLSYPSATGMFTCFRGLDLGAGLRLVPQFGETGMSLL